ncbi:MAG: ankyrin repeat domain-containing protein [Elusimicrobiota bacterium]|jgi:ankyrin repeat protein|nr:ankyrin repeat domain-containing protein [Elusimicrobiota bacterium]
MKIKKYVVLLTLFAVALLLPPLISNAQEQQKAKETENAKVFIEAAATGDIEIVTALLKAKINPNIQDGNALKFATLFGHKEIVEILLEDRRTDPNIKDNHGNTALMEAAQKGHKEIVEILLEDHRTDPNIKNNEGWTALTWATIFNINKEIVEILLKAGADPNIKDNNGWTALRHATVRDHKEIVEILKKAGAKE